MLPKNLSFRCRSFLVRLATLSATSPISLLPRFSSRCSFHSALVSKLGTASRCIASSVILLSFSPSGAPGSPIQPLELSARLSHVDSRCYLSCISLLLPFFLPALYRLRCSRPRPLRALLYPRPSFLTRTRASLLPR